MRDAATSFALQTEQSVQRDSRGLGDIRALCPELLWLYIALNGVEGGRGDSEAPIENQTVKIFGDGPPYLGIGRTRRQRCRSSPSTLKRIVWWSIVIF